MVLLWGVEVLGRVEIFVAVCLPFGEGRWERLGAVSDGGCGDVSNVIGLDDRRDEGG